MFAQSKSPSCTAADSWTGISLLSGCLCLALHVKALSCQFSKVSFFKTVLVALSTCPVLVCVWSTFMPSVSEFSFSELNVIFFKVFEERSHCKQQAVAPSFASAGQLFTGRCCSVHTGRINSALQLVARKFAQGLLLQGDGCLWRNVMAEQSSDCFSFLCRASNPWRQKPCSVPFLAASLCLWG